MGSQTQYLEWHGQQYRVRVKVPAKVRSLLGRGKLTAPLHTSNLKEANERKWAHVHRLKAAIAAAERAISAHDPIEAEALAHRLVAQGGEEDAYVLEFRAEQIEAAHGLDTAKAFADLASGRVTPLDHHTDDFVKHQGYRMKSEGDFRRVLGWLSAWLRDKHSPVAIEAVTRKTAGSFIAESLAVGRSDKKATSYLGFLRTYWRWLVEKGHAAENPWSGQSLPASPKQKRDAEPDKGKRPFTDDEVVKLLSGDPGVLLADLMRVGALSGMRVEEMCQLFVSDCAGDSFNIWAGKTDNARRTVPIHSGLRDIIERRTKDREPQAFLFDDLPPVPPSRETRSDPAIKRFTRYRREMGVDERPNGKAKSNTDFHSFRRWFIRKARNARLAGIPGFDEWTLTWVVGHTDSDRAKSLDLSQHGYAGEDAEKSKRALVEAVKLP